MFIAGLGAGLGVSLTTGMGTARAAPVDDPRIPLSDNFSRLELVTTATVVVAGSLALALSPKIWPPTPSIGPPAPSSFDRRVSDDLYQAHGTGDRFLGRVPDRAGLYVLPYLPGVFYGGEALWRARTGRTLREGGDQNPDHRFAAYAEALGWTTLLNGVTKVVVGRARPYVVLNHPELADAGSEDNVSFFSGHSSVIFCAASFVALDASDRLRWRVLADAPPVERFLLGTLVPYTVSFGVAALVSVSRIIDQQHWASDVIVGAGVGTLVAHLAYVAHFDHWGRPRRRLGADGGPPAAAAMRVVPTGNGLALAGLLP
ncbi:MAG TPA: phosphatase PAP2 family protein [Polyangia bacterium]|jgi:membrane-associated phospholipid phosphatase|nr:phosphatase PAP2 family protein [Polyangia bacterium]